MGRDKIISLVVVVVSMAAQVFAYEFAGGTGQPSDPYRIATASELISIGSDPNLLNRCFVLIADVDLDGQAFSTAVIAPDTDAKGGFDGAAFTGSLDGRGYKVTHLTITVNTPQGGFLGLFGRVGDGGQVVNLGIECVIVCGGKQVRSVGALAGENNGLISRCYAKGSISCPDWSDDVGGLVGLNTGTMAQCCASVNTSVGQHGNVAGFAGSNLDSGIIHQCYVAAANISSGRYSNLAGLVMSNAGAISQCYTAATVSKEMFTIRAGLTQSNAGLLDSSYFLSSVDGGGTDNGLGIALSSKQMKEADSLAGWDFYSVDRPAGVWLIPGQGYPVLAWQREASGLAWLPRVRGATLVDAQAVLADAGLVFGSVFYDFDIAVPRDKVIGLNPSYPVAKGTVVDVLVSSGVYDWKLNTGDGSAAKPYEISTAGQLECLGQDKQLWGSRFALTADIDLSGRLYPDALIAAYPNEGNRGFAGTLDGRGYSIVGLTIASARDYVGLFGHVVGTGQIRGLTLHDARVLGRSSLNGVGGTGILAGSSDASVTDCSVSGSVAGGRQVGGLVGRNGGRVIRCDVAGAVSGNARVGGLVGYSSSNSNSISECFSTGEVSGNATVGGLVGLASGPLTQCFATGAVSGKENLGGLVGQAYSTASMSQCFAVGNVAGGKNLGGFVGNSAAVVERCYATGSVSGSDGLGGLAGNVSAGTISECYAAGAVIGVKSCGGLVGIRLGDIVTSFWDTETSGLSQSAGGTGLTTTQMRTAATFASAGWDFTNTWMICEAQDYPHLRWEGIECSGK